MFIIDHHIHFIKYLLLQNRQFLCFLVLGILMFLIVVLYNSDLAFSA